MTNTWRMLESNAQMNSLRSTISSTDTIPWRARSKSSSDKTKRKNTSLKNWKTESASTRKREKNKNWTLQTRSNCWWTRKSRSLHRKIWSKKTPNHKLPKQEIEWVISPRFSWLSIILMTNAKTMDKKMSQAERSPPFVSTSTWMDMLKSQNSSTSQRPVLSLHFGNFKVSRYLSATWRKSTTIWERSQNFKPCSWI